MPCQPLSENIRLPFDTPCDIVDSTDPPLVTQLQPFGGSHERIMPENAHAKPLRGFHSSLEAFLIVDTVKAKALEREEP